MLSLPRLDLGRSFLQKQEREARIAYENVETHPISPVTCVVAIRLAIEVVHDSSHPSACAHEALAKV
jgi:hypothetical protein